MKKMKSTNDMTLEEFANELAEINYKATFISNSVVGTRQDRSYSGQKRGSLASTESPLYRRSETGRKSSAKYD